MACSIFTRATRKANLLEARTKIPDPRISSDDSLLVSYPRSRIVGKICFPDRKQIEMISFFFFFYLICPDGESRKLTFHGAFRNRFRNNLFRFIKRRALNMDNVTLRDRAIANLYRNTETWRDTNDRLAWICDFNSSNVIRFSDNYFNLTFA